MGEGISAQTKAMVLTALITAVSSVLGTLITVWPQLRKQATTEKGPKQEMSIISPPHEDQYTIAGVVQGGAQGDAYVAAADERWTVGVDGKFQFAHQQHQSYQLLFVTPGGTQVFLIDPNNQTTSSKDVTIAYTYRKE